MSDPKDFLSRWSQRKLNPEETPVAADTAAPSGSEKNSAGLSAPVAEFDITTLPSLESIGANSDIRAFLQRGVPASLTRAALRRAWSTDPAIRDFIGLSENSWDFNAPDELRGFGPLSVDEVRQAMERFFGMQAGETTGQVARENIPEEPKNLSETEQAAGLDNEPDPTFISDLQHSSDVAAQHTKENDLADFPPKVRHHGGALPE